MSSIFENLRKPEHASCSFSYSAYSLPCPEKPNGDNLLVLPKHGVFGVFDGVSKKNPLGDTKSSRLAAELVKNRSSRQKENFIPETLLLEINTVLEKKKALTTATIAHIQKHDDSYTLTLSYLGDSPAYLISGDAITPLTNEDEHVAYLVPQQKWGKCLTQYLGMKPGGCKPTTIACEMKQGDCLILSTDGLDLSPDTMLEIMNDPRIPSEMKAKILVEQSREQSTRSSLDDTTAVTIQIL